MSVKIHDMKAGAGGPEHLVSNGWYAVNPAGDVVLVPPLSELKAGWRIASQLDAGGGPAPSDPVPAPEPAPAEPQSGE